MEEGSAARMEGESGLVLRGFAAEPTTMRPGTDDGGGVGAPATRTSAMESRDHVSFSGYDPFLNASFHKFTLLVV